VPTAPFAQGLQERRTRCDQVHVAGDRLDDHRRDAAAMGVEGRGDLLAVVVVEDHRVLRQVGGNTGRTRVAEGEQARPGLHQQTVGVAVVAALELEQQVAAGEAARETDGAHRRLGAGADQAHHFE
jgi:hypothetical protein